MKEQRSICLGGTQISYTLERKAVKNVNLRLRPETGLLVSAPKDAPLALVERILQQHGERILQTLRRYDTVSEQPPQYPIHYTAGETVLYLGKYCRLSVEQGSRDSVQVQGETIRSRSHFAKRRSTTGGSAPVKKRCGISAAQSIPSLHPTVSPFRRSASVPWCPSGETAGRSGESSHSTPACWQHRCAALNTW